MHTEDYNWSCAWCKKEIDLNIMTPEIKLTKGIGTVIEYTSNWQIFNFFFGGKEIPFFIRPIDLAEDFDMIACFCSEDCRNSVKAVLDKILVGYNGN